MNNQDLKVVFDDLRDNNDSGHRAYRVAEQMAPKTGTGAPAVAAQFYGQEYHDITDPLASVIYKATGMGNVAPADDWSVMTQA